MTARRRDAAVAETGHRTGSPSGGGRVSTAVSSSAAVMPSDLDVLQRLAGNRTTRQLVETRRRPAVAQRRAPGVQRDWVTETPEYVMLEGFNFNWFRAVDTLAHDESETREQSENEMRTLIAYRDLVVDRLLRETMTEVTSNMAKEDPAASGMGDITRGKIDYVSRNEAGYLIRAFAAGSTNLTSDYDITFSIPRMPHLETEAVIIFNQRFRELFGLESGMVFDTNVYTSGFMPPETKELLDEVPEDAPSYTKKDQLRLEGGTGKTDKHQLQLAFSVLPIRQFFGAGEAGGSEYWRFAGRALANLEAGLVGSIVPRELQDQAINDALVIFTVAGKLYAETEAAIAAKKRELTPEGARHDEDVEFNIDMLARNTLYEDQLKTVSGLLRQIDAMVAEFKTRPPNDARAKAYERLVSRFQIEQGKALVYANEAYFSGGPAVHVVLGMQKGDSIRLGRQQQLQSLLMNIGYKLAHFSHKMHDAGGRDETRRFGRATYSTAKYGERVADVVGGTGTRGSGSGLMDRAKELLGMQSQPLRSETSTRAGVFAAKDVDLASVLAKQELDVLAREVDVVRSIKKSKQLSAVQKEEAAATYGPRDIEGYSMMAAFLSIAEKSFAPYYIDKYRATGRLWAKGGSGGSVDTPSVL